ncbi:MAG: GHKL domain-containing protein, partial [Saprospiraceae bacterium]|nr:GHKL domain-containing protein [Saprospiraceae bacterium]
KFEQNAEEKVRLMAMIARIYTFYTEFYNVDSGFYYAQEAIDLQQQIISSKKSNLAPEQLEQLFRLKEIVAGLLHSLGNYSRSLQLRLENLEMAEEGAENTYVAWAINNLVEDYSSMKDFESVLKYALKARDLISTIGATQINVNALSLDNLADIADAYLHLDQLDSALVYAKKMGDFIKEQETEVDPEWFRYLMSNTHLLLADIYAQKGENQTAKNYYQQVIDKSPSFGGQTVAEAKKGMSEIMNREGKIREATRLAREAIEYFQENRIDIQSWGENSELYVAEISPLLANLYHQAGKVDSAYHYLELTTRLRDSLYNADRIRQFETLTFNEASRQQRLEQARIDARQEFQNKIKLYGLLTGLAGVILVSILLYRNNRQKQKANALLRTQKLELENTVNELRITQRQLIQSEKMASLGELTAGIAHEIQNPLNFVNNFSDVSRELLDELTDELEKGNREDIHSISKDLKNNLSKISAHGHRASSIVQSMLLHSRGTAGIKELTDVNALCDEYLRLAFHGMRARDKSFSADFKTDFDPKLDKINLVPQEFSRVLLNLINNAFYATQEKAKKNINGYEPMVILQTQKHENRAEIRIEDNGQGVSEELKEKIFQPFFTTKPAGQGTGLGLSLSYDIIKAQGGTLEMESEAGKGTSMIISIPLD